MNRGIDHLVLCVDDLEEARTFYGAMGFQLTPSAQHPFGTANSLVQLQGNFLELLTVADATLIKPPPKGQFSFAQYNQTYLAEGEGMSMLVFESQDARADQAEFKLKQLDTYAPFDFSRKAVLPSGEEVTVGFSLAFATHPEMPRAVYFCCQQHAPQHFWKPAYQTHDNGAQAVASVVLVAAEPGRYVSFFQALQGTDAVTETADGYLATTARGTVSVISPEAYEHTYGPGTAPDLAQGPRFAAMVIDVADLDTVARICADNNVAIETTSGAIRVSSAEAFGTLIEFRESQT